MPCPICKSDSCQCKLQRLTPAGSLYDFPAYLYCNTQHLIPKTNLTPTHAYSPFLRMLPDMRQKRTSTDTLSLQPETSSSTGPDDREPRWTSSSTKAWLSIGIFATLVAYSTHMERNKKERVYRGYTTVDIIKNVFGSFFDPHKKTFTLPSNVVAVTRPIYIMKEAFKMGISPIPMPVPGLVPAAKLFASSQEFKLFFNVSMYLLTSQVEHLDRLNRITGNTRTGRELAKEILTGRNVRALGATTGLVAGSYINSLFLSKIPFIDAGLFTYQALWDGALILNMLAMTVGEQADSFKKSDPRAYQTLMRTIQDHNRGIFKQWARASMGLGLAGTSVLWGVVVTKFFQYVLSDKNDKDAS